ncbi:MAG: hypothetical protein ABEL76_11645 [Bradymonadaceae bacterium]
MVSTVVAAHLWGGAVLGYIGPGPGLSLIGALIGLIVTIVSAIGAVLLWPIRKALGTDDDDEETDESDGQGEADSSDGAQRDGAADG